MTQGSPRHETHSNCKDVQNVSFVQPENCKKLSEPHQFPATATPQQGNKINKSQSNYYIYNFIY